MTAFQTGQQRDDTAIAAGFRAAIDVARRFVGATAPNPPVGCALLDRDGAILTAAAHHKAGTFHAEARALAQCAELGLTDRIHTAVVTLEPCNHSGRTPPCSEALLATPVKTVWVGCADPNPRVAGGGGARLTAAGRTVRWLSEATTLPDQRALLAECRGLIAPFVYWASSRKAWFTVKQAVDAGGSMIPPTGRTTFTSPAALDLAHALRRATDAVVTGIGTVRADLPGLDVRRVADHVERRRILLVCGRRDNAPAAWLEQAERRFDVRFCAAVEDAPAMLAEAGALWALVEAGPTLLAAMRAGDVWDDWLRIEQRAAGGERLTVASRHRDTPLALFADRGLDFVEPTKADQIIKKEDAACFPA